MKNKKIKIVWALACNSSSTDSNTNNISLFNIIEEFTVTPPDQFTPEKLFKAGILVQHPFEIVILFSRVGNDTNKELDYEAIFTSLDPLDKPLGETIFPIKIEKGKKRLRLNVKINGITATMEGEYTFKIATREVGSRELEEITSVPLDIKLNNNRVNK